jgi:hypothetical protein
MTVQPRAFATLLSALVLASFSSTFLFGQSELTGEAYMKWYEKKYLGGGSSQSYTPEELVTIMQAKERNDDRAVLRGCDEVIKRDPKLFYSLAQANWVKSQAYIERGWAQYRLTKDPHYVMADEEKAAELGNMRAARDVSEKMMAKYHGNEQAAFIDASSLGKYLRIGAELGDTEAAELLAVDVWPNPLTEPEKAYWALLAQGRSTDKTGESWDFTIHLRYALVNPKDLERTIAQLSPLGGLTPPGPHNLPGRGVSASMFADARLRHEYNFNNGKRAPKTRAASPEALEVFKYQRAVTDSVGHASAYLLVPATRKFADPYMVPMTTEELSRHLTPSDVVVTRCGPFTHMATIYKIDRKVGTVGFVAGLFEFWQPTHNSCVTKFDLVPFVHGGYLATVSLQELLPMIQEVITYRDRKDVHPALAENPNYVTVYQFEHSDFFEFFRVSEVIEKEIGPNQRIIRYMTGAYQNQIFFSLRTDRQYRIQEALFSINRDWIGGREEPNHLARDFTKSFVLAATPAGSSEQAKPAAQAIWEGRLGAEQETASRHVACASISNQSASVLDAYFGKVDRCVIALPNGELVFANRHDNYFDQALNVSVKTSALAK